ncbi:MULTISPECIES: LacI family DNA-binding transcriptional regulator [Rathayibacter]|uniref:LacI family DNA-binding transcriptional regulator n=1 Tax=Rathayibacter TaxID=33886 RepID=UPI0006FA2D5B|nr:MULTISPECIES: LacI family DNA-binding transcriptional regulator [Rathayibacter]KQQ22026.1 hypothetical protein ASF48_01990 [Rathayibacter sp. Leaf299]MCJ1695905.1 LacI family transcriptional regulator [Rathayibacter caricis]
MPQVGIRDVAARAGVSVTTASYALNRPERVSSAAMAAVADAVAALGYIPNVAARQLRAGKSMAVGMAVVNLGNPFYAELALGAEHGAEEAGYSLVLGATQDSAARELRYLDLFARQRVDGVLLAPIASSLDHLDVFEQRGVPVVLVDQVDPRGRLLSVALDDVLGGRMAAEHLLANGCRRLLFLGGTLGIPQVRDRFDGCSAAVRASGAAFSSIETVGMGPGLGRELGERILAMPADERPDGIFAANDELALGVMQSLVRGGVSIPGDIALVGYDDIPFADAAVVPLTSVRQPTHRMGERAAELLIAAIRGDADVRSAGFDPELIVRASTGGVR